MAKNKNISISLEGAKCIEIEKTPSSGDKVIDFSNTGDKVIETSASGGKVIDSVVEGGKVIDIIGEDESQKPSKSHGWVLVLVFILLLTVVGGGFIGYTIIEEIEQQERMEAQRRYEQQQAQEKADRKQREAKQREAARKEKERMAAAKREAEQREAEDMERIQAEEEVRHKEQHLAERHTAPQISQQRAPQRSSQTPSSSEVTKRYYQGHIELTTKDGYSIRWEYNGYYTEEEFRKIERQFYESAGYTTDSEKMQNLLREIQGL